MRERGTLWKFVRSQIGQRITTLEIPVRSPSLHEKARRLGRRVRDFGFGVQRMLFRYREAILERQYVQERISEAACDLYASSCTLARLDHLLVNGNHVPPEMNQDIVAGRYFMRLADRRIKQHLRDLTDNDDEMTTLAANLTLGKR